MCCSCWSAFCPTRSGACSASWSARGIDEESELFMWARAVATAVLAGVIAKIVLFPPGRSRVCRCRSGSARLPAASRLSCWCGDRCSRACWPARSCCLPARWSMVEVCLYGCVSQCGRRNIIPQRRRKLLRLLGEHVRRLLHAGGRFHRHALLARDDVDVEVKYDLAAGAFVELLDGDAVGAEYLHADLGDLLRDLDDVGEVVGRNIEDVARGRLRQHQRVAGRARHDVEEGKRLVVLVDLVARQFAAQDLREDVVGIVGGHRLLLRSR